MNYIRVLGLQNRVHLHKVFFMQCTSGAFHTFPLSTHRNFSSDNKNHLQLIDQMYLNIKEEIENKLVRQLYMDEYKTTIFDLNELDPQKQNAVKVCRWLASILDSQTHYRLCRVFEANEFMRVQKPEDFFKVVKNTLGKHADEVIPVLRKCHHLIDDKLLLTESVKMNTFPHLHATAKPTEDHINGSKHPNGKHPPSRASVAPLIDTLNRLSDRKSQAKEITMSQLKYLSKSFMRKKPPLSLSATSETSIQTEDIQKRDEFIRNDEIVYEEQSGAPYVQPSIFSVFVRNLPYEISISKLRTVFSRFGKVVGVELWRPNPIEYRGKRDNAEVKNSSQNKSSNENMNSENSSNVKEHTPSNESKDDTVQIWRYDENENDSQESQPELNKNSEPKSKSKTKRKLTFASIDKFSNVTIRGPSNTHALIYFSDEKGKIMTLDPVISIFGIKMKNRTCQVVDPKTKTEIYIGNLPLGMPSTDIIRELNRIIEPRLQVKLHHQHSMGFASSTSFCFVKFENYSQAQDAIHIFRQCKIAGRNLKTGFRV